MENAYTHLTLEDRCHMILTLHERHSRLLLAARPPGKAAAPIAQIMQALLAPDLAPQNGRGQPLGGGLYTPGASL